MPEGTHAPEPLPQAILLQPIRSTSDEASGTELNAVPTLLPTHRVLHTRLSKRKVCSTLLLFVHDDLMFTTRPAGTARRLPAAAHRPRPGFRCRASGSPPALSAPGAHPAPCAWRRRTRTRCRRRRRCAATPRLRSVTHRCIVLYTVELNSIPAVLGHLLSMRQTFGLPVFCHSSRQERSSMASAAAATNEKTTHINRQLQSHSQRLSAAIR